MRPREVEWRWSGRVVGWWPEGRGNKKQFKAPTSGGKMQRSGSSRMSRQYSSASLPLPPWHAPAGLLCRWPRPPLSKREAHPRASPGWAPVYRGAAAVERLTASLAGYSQLESDAKAQFQLHARDEPQCRASERDSRELAQGHCYKAAHLLDL